MALKWLNNDKKKVLSLCTMFDCAGVAFNLSVAINKYSKEYTCRQAISYKLESFDFPNDLKIGDYSQEEWMDFIASADVIHFNHGLPDMFSPGFPWWKFKDKTFIYHSHSGWEPGKCHRKLYENGSLFKRIAMCDAIIGCSPVDSDEYKGGVWIPNVMREHPALKPLPDKKWDKLIVSHSPSSLNNKSTAEFNAACEWLKKCGHDFTHDVIFGVTLDECLKRKQKSHLFFDNMWQGYHGMSSFQAMIQGIPALARLDKRIVEGYKNLFGDCPIINVDNAEELANKISYYLRNVDRLKEDGVKASTWMGEHYQTASIVSMYDKLYSETAAKKKTQIATKQRKEKYSILLINHRHGDQSWTRGRWIEKAFNAAGHDITVCKNTWKQQTTKQIFDRLGRHYDFCVQLAEYSCPADLADGSREDHSVPMVLWTDDSVVWNTFNGLDHKPHFQGLHYRNYLPHYDLVFELFEESLPLVKFWSKAPVYLLPHAWEPDVFQGHKDISLKHDVTFCGRYEKAEPGFTGEGWYLDRGHLIETLRAAGINVNVFFSKNEAEWTRVILESKIVINKSLNHNLNMRYFETIGAGRFLLSERCNQAEKLFGDAVVFFDNPDHAARLIKQYLADEKGREAIAARGHDLVLQSGHRYLDRVKELIAIVEKELL